MPDNIEPPVSQPVQTTPPRHPDENQVRMWNMFCHLSALSGVMIPFGNVIGPLLIWQIKKQEIPSVEAHGKASLNFQLTVLLAVAACTVLGFILSVILVGVLFFFLIPPVAICGLVFAVIAGVKANEGKEYRYPYSLNLVK
jgi:uncharacterized Tic20 family protein